LVQAAARVISPPGEAMEDWQVLVNLGMALGTGLAYTSSAQVRADVAAVMAGEERYEALASLTFARPVPLRHWLQASNPSERWKWDWMFQDLPPVKGASPAPARVPGALPLRPVE
jgi:NADH dehydrogenase/NADH:ubiquinone oxidoreductase subunit G